MKTKKVQRRISIDEDMWTRIQERYPGSDLSNLIHELGYNFLLVLDPYHAREAFKAAAINTKEEIKRC